MASTRSLRSMSQRKSGRIRSTPYIVGSGNISPASTMTMRPSCSIAAQLRPISPRPPRKVTRTVSLATRCLQRGHDFRRVRVESVVTLCVRQSALADVDAEVAQGRLGRHGVRVEVARLEGVTRREALVEGPRLRPVTARGAL